MPLSVVPGQNFDLLGFVWWSVVVHVPPPGSHAIPLRRCPSTKTGSCNDRELLKVEVAQGIFVGEPQAN